MTAPSPFQFNALNWYWIDKTGRIFSSLKNQLVNARDPVYLAFVAQNGGTTSWPIDANGNQTTAALQAVMQFYSPFYVVNLPPP